jgi:tetratricopeptide (TPR) repeat protein
MIALRQLTPLIALLTLLIISPCLRTGRASTQTQQPTAEERDRAIALYKQGDSAGAIQILEPFTKAHSDDADAWYFLGMAYYHKGWFASSRPAFEHLLLLRPSSPDVSARLAYTYILSSEPERAEKAARRAIELGDQSAEPHHAIAEASFRSGDFAKAIQEADLALQSRSDFAPALITKSLAQSSLKQPAAAAASLEQFLAISPDQPDADVWREQLDRLHKSNNTAASSTSANTITPPNPDGPFSGKEVTTKMRVLAKPEPTYTDGARKAGVTGTVILRCVFGSDGEVKNVIV